MLSPLGLWFKVLIPLALAPVCLPAAPSAEGAKGLYIVIKADDLVVQNGTVPALWEKFAGYLRERTIKSSVGIITHSLAGDTPDYFDWIKEQHASGLIEFWFHGHTHRHWKDNGADMYEFKGPSFEEQREHFTLGQRLAREKLGFAFKSFAAPYNAIDANTTRALAEDPDISIWMYGDVKNPAGKTVLDRDWGVNIENPVMVPNLAKFTKGYAATSAKRRYYVIQAHPQQWDDERFAEFTRIIDFLVEKEARFVTPTELVRALKL